MVLNSPIESLPNTSTVTIRRLKSIGINTYWDLLNYFPYRYEDYSVVAKANSVQEGEKVTIIGEVTDSTQQRTRRGLKIQKITITDDSGTIDAYWYNQPYLLTLFHKGTILAVSGEIKKFGNKVQIYPNEYEIVPFSGIASLKHTGRLVPVYSEKKGLSSKTVREKIWRVLSGIEDNSIREPLPSDILGYNALIKESVAYKSIHIPESVDQQRLAWFRLAFDELFIIQLSSQLIKRKWESETIGKPFEIKRFEDSLKDFIDSLPFTLTNAQNKVFDEIKADLKLGKPMNRFLQGEVGSGKTVIAALACYCAYLNGYKSLFMAPTEILAQQHFTTISRFLNIKDQKSKIKKINVSLLTGSSKISDNKMKNADIIVGTHALIQKQISFDNVGLVIVDEQHRFGVAQRAELKNKGMNPHLLTMTATPIPRTVMLTLYGELDISIIDEMPAGRIPIKTYYIPKQKREDCYNWIKKQIRSEGLQVFIVCPLIEESGAETLVTVKAAKKEFEYLSQVVFKDFKLGLLHGKLKGKEKITIMEEFKNKKFDILVATPVVEVGVDIPNANIMLIEGAERFGLAQLHQLRGRVGRSNKQSHCLVFSDAENEQILKRLSYFAHSSNGNQLAQKDLETRGPGNLFGREQHGFIDLAIASLADYPMIEKTKNAVHYFLKHHHINEFPELQKRIEKFEVKKIARD